MSQKEQKSFEQLSMQQKIEHEQSTQLEQNQVIRTTRNYGCMIPIMIDTITRQPKYLLGPHFYVFAFAFILALLLFLFIVVQLVGRANHWLLGLSSLLGLYFMYCYLRIGFSDPGIASRVEMPQPSLRKSDKYCVPCRIVRPIGTRHCYYCDICIQGYDHHCPWVGKCIGKKNLCQFYQFLLSIFMFLGCLLVTSLISS